MNVSLLSTDKELDKVALVMLQLRPNYTYDSITKQMKKQLKQGYQLAFVENNGMVIAVAGFVINEKLAWGKHLYVDDLVTLETKRSTGAGKFLMDWLKQYAKEKNCEQLHLDSGVEKFSAHRFYLREQFKIASHHFSITDL